MSVCLEVRSCGCVPYLTGGVRRPFTHVCTAMHEGNVCLHTFALILSTTKSPADDGSGFKRHGIDDPGAKYQNTPISNHLSTVHGIHSKQKAQLKRQMTLQSPSSMCPKGCKSASRRSSSLAMSIKQKTVRLHLSRHLKQLRQKHLRP